MGRVGLGDEHNGNYSYELQDFWRRALARTVNDSDFTYVSGLIEQSWRYKNFIRNGTGNGKGMKLWAAARSEESCTQWSSLKIICVCVCVCATKMKINMACSAPYTLIYFIAAFIVQISSPASQSWICRPVCIPRTNCDTEMWGFAAPKHRPAITTMHGFAPSKCGPAARRRGSLPPKQASALCVSFQPSVQPTSNGQGSTWK